MLQTQDLRVDQEKEPCIGLTQENLIENSVQDSLPYIPFYMVCTSYYVSQIRYSLVVILELNGISEVQYKDVMMIDDGKYQ